MMMLHIFGPTNDVTHFCPRNDDVFTHFGTKNFFFTHFGPTNDVTNLDQQMQGSKKHSCMGIRYAKLFEAAKSMFKS